MSIVALYNLWWYIWCYVLLLYNIYSIYFWDKSPWNAYIFIFSRIDVNSNKDQKKQQTIFPCLEENEVEKMARAHKSSCCSCSPPTSPSTYVYYIFFVKLKFNFMSFYLCAWKKNSWNWIQFHESFNESWIFHIFSKYYFFRSDENSEKNDENEVEEQAAKIQPEPETAIMSSKEYKQQPDLNTFTGVLMASKSWLKHKIISWLL